jgi:hypothetical protein
MKITRITCRSGRRSADDRERSHTQITQFGTAPTGPRGDHVADQLGGSRATAVTGDRHAAPLVL